MRAEALGKACECYKQSTSRKPRRPSYWMSIAIVYYMINQPSASLDSLARAIKLNPFIWQSWYNLAILVSSDSLQSLF